jgi:hypothetical protein
MSGERKVAAGSAVIPIVVHPDAPPIRAWAVTVATRPCDWAQPARDILWPDLARLRERQVRG